MLNLDTHVFLSALAGELSPSEEKILGRNVWSLSAISIWEIAKLVELNRIEVDIESAEFSVLLSSIHIWPITLEVCRATLRLDFDSDPADEIIAATSIVHNLPLLTRDRKIKKSKQVPFAV